MSHDRTGEPVDLDNPTVASREKVAHDPRCRRGWLGVSEDDRPIPCTTCKPWLKRTPDNQTGAWQ